MLCWETKISYYPWPSQVIGFLLPAKEFVKEKRNNKLEAIVTVGLKKKIKIKIKIIIIKYNIPCS